MGRLRLSEWSLRALLILLVVDVFIIAPIAQDDTLPALRPVIHSIVLLAGIAIASRSRVPTMTVVGVLAVVSYGDITPVHPVARSLAALGSVVGQLFPALLLKRLVSIELHYRQQHGH